MRLKTFTAPTMADAMGMVRQALGDDAIIVATYRRRRGRGVRITAALDDDAAGDAVMAQVAGDALIEDDSAPLAPPAVVAAEPAPTSDPVRERLLYHGTPRALADKLAWAAAHEDDEQDSLGLPQALAQCFRFDPLAVAPRRPVMLVGPSASGKTVTVAKLAARAVLAGHRVNVITTDTVRAGAVSQLASFTRLLKQPLQSVDNPQELAKALAGRNEQTVTLIDSPGTNPFAPTELDDLAGFIRAADVEPLLVLAAGLDSTEAGEIAAAFAGIGVRQMIATRLDATRRLGSLLAAAQAGGLTLGLVSITPFITNGLTLVDARALARLLLRDPSIGEISSELQKAAQ